MSDKGLASLQQQLTKALYLKPALEAALGSVSVC